MCAGAPIFKVKHSSSGLPEVGSEASRWWHPRCFFSHQPGTVWEAGGCHRRLLSSRSRQTQGRKWCSEGRNSKASAKNEVRASSVRQN